MGAKLKIAYVARFFWPSIGGSAVVTDALAKGLAECGDTVALLLPQCAYESMAVRTGPPPEPPAGLSIHYAGPRLWRFAGNTASYLFLLRKVIRATFEAHVVLAQYHHSNLSAFCAAIASTITRRPLIIRVDDLIVPPVTGIQKIIVFVLKWTTQWSFRRARLVLVPRSELVEPVRATYTIKNIEVCPNGVEGERFNARNRSGNLRRMIGSDHIVVFAGGVERLYALDVLLSAAAILRENLPDLKILILGDGPDLRRLVCLAESLGLRKSVEFLGAVDRDMVPKYLASADVGIGPLRASIDTLGAAPIKVLEYMASGCIVVTARGTVSGRLLADGRNGLITKPGDANDVARAVMRIFLDQRFATRMRRNARATVEEGYDWKTVVSELRTHLLGLIRF